jgi:hypothetical protein
MVESGSVVEARAGGRLVAHSPIHSDGRYLLASLPASLYVLDVVDAKGRMLRPVDGGSVAVAPGARDERNLVLSSTRVAAQTAARRPATASGTGAITGTVTAADTGRGLAVNVLTLDLEGNGYLNGSSDTTGNYTISGMDPGSYVVLFTPPSSSGTYVQQYYNNQTSYATANRVVVTAGNTTANVDAVLAVGGQISGVVTAADTGVGLGGVEIQVYDADGNYLFNLTAPTDTSGVYTTPGGLPSGNYFVRFQTLSSTNYVSEYYGNVPTITTAKTVAVTAGSMTANVDAALPVGGVITGTVTAADTHAGLAYPLIDVFDSDGNRIAGGSSDANGNYTAIGLATGQYTVQFTCPSACGAYAGQYYNARANAAIADSVQVTAGQTTPGINAVLAVGGQITGVVTAANTFPIGYANVAVYDESDNLVDQVMTTADGSYVTDGIAAGSYGVLFTIPPLWTPTYAAQYYNNKLSLATADAVTVTTGSTTANVNAVLGDGGQISGTVTASDTGLVPGPVFVDVIDSSGNTVATGWPNVAGNYIASEIAAGTYRVHFVPISPLLYTDQYYNDKSSLATADTVTVTGVNTTPNVNAVLAKVSNLSSILLPAVFNGGGR